jgi:hypothetical protein
MPAYGPEHSADDMLTGLPLSTDSAHSMPMTATSIASDATTRAFLDHSACRLLLHAIKTAIAAGTMPMTATPRYHGDPVE